MTHNINGRSETHIFLCGSIYTLFSAINICENFTSDEECDLLYFFSSHDEKDRVSALLEGSGAFKNVYFCIDVRKNKLLAATFIFLTTLFQKNLTKLNGSQIQYTKYSVAYSQNALFLAVAQNTFGFDRVAYIDEGLSSYTGKTINIKYRNKALKILNAFSANNLLTPSEYYLYATKMYVGPSVSIKEITWALPSSIIKNSQRSCRKSTEIFNNNRIIFLPNHIASIANLLDHKSNYSHKFEKRVDAMFKRVLNSFNFPVVCRPHPNSSSMELESYKIIYDSNTCPWEILAEKITEKHVLVTYFSTTCFIPKIIYDTEPYILFLHRLLPEKVLNADQMLIKFKATYFDKSKILAPSSYAELDEHVRSILSN